MEYTTANTYIYRIDVCVGVPELKYFLPRSVRARCGIARPHLMSRVKGSSWPTLSRLRVHLSPMNCKKKTMTHKYVNP